MSKPMLTLGLLGTLLLTLASAQDGAKKDRPAPNHRIVRVSEPDAVQPAEVAVAINPADPDHLVGVSMQGGRKLKLGVTNVSYVSRDGGATWKTHFLANPDKRSQGDDAVTFSHDGLAVRCYIAFEGIRIPRPKRASNGVFVSTSRDGAEWSPAVPVVDHLNTVTPFEDKPWVRVDTSKGSKHRGNLYLAWTRFDAYGSKDPADKSHVYFSRSTDSGKSFSVPQRISKTPGDCLDKSDTLMGAMCATGPKGEVYVVWGGPQGLAFVASTDAGLNFGKEAIVADTPGGWDFSVKGLSRCNGLPMMGVDLSDGPDRGTIHVNWVDRRNGDPDVFVASSRDGGASWSKPIRVNDDPVKNGKEQFFSWMAVDPADGSVNVAFYDRRDTQGALTGLTLARSIDGGRTFRNHPIAQEPFECTGKAFFGDYLGVDACAGRVAVLYQHYVAPTKLAVSGAFFRFELGRQEIKAVAADAK